MVSVPSIVARLLYPPPTEFPERNEAFAFISNFLPLDIKFPPKEPLDHRFTSIKNINKFGVVSDAATAYIIAKAILRATYGREDNIDYSIPFTIELQDGYVWSVDALYSRATFTTSYNIAIDKRDGRIVNLSAEK